IGVVILTGDGPDAFCAGGDQRVRGAGGYVGADGIPRLNVLDLQRQIRTLPKVGSFDGGFGASYMARIVGQKKAREIWFLCRQYDAKQALDMGLVNAVVPLDKLEEETVKWCREILQHSPTAIRLLKSSFNADCDGQMGLLDLGGDATLLYYLSEEAQ